MCLLDHLNDVTLGLLNGALDGLVGGLVGNGVPNPNAVALHHQEVVNHRLCEAVEVS